jgi:putative transcriptional regulator
LHDDVTITTFNDIIHTFATDTGPKNALVTLGYVSWTKNQLVQEIINNT